MDQSCALSLNITTDIFPKSQGRSSRRIQLQQKKTRWMTKKLICRCPYGHAKNIAFHTLLQVITLPLPAHLPACPPCTTTKNSVQLACGGRSQGKWSSNSHTHSSRLTNFCSAGMWEEISRQVELTLSHALISGHLPACPPWKETSSGANTLTRNHPRSPSCVPPLHHHRVVLPRGHARGNFKARVAHILVHVRSVIPYPILRRRGSVGGTFGSF